MNVEIFLKKIRELILEFDKKDNEYVANEIKHIRVVHDGMYTYLNPKTQIQNTVTDLPIKISFDNPVFTLTSETIYQFVKSFGFTGITHIIVYNYLYGSTTFKYKHV